MISVLNMEENTVEKGENTGFQIFSFLIMFPKALCICDVHTQECIEKELTVQYDSSFISV